MFLEYNLDKEFHYKCQLLMETFTLCGGKKIPLVGLGTFKLRCNIDKDLIFNVLDVALQHGYRLFDTASCYRNEKDIGHALEQLYQKHCISRTDIFITSKLAPKEMGYESAVATCKRSLNDLRCDYIDYYLIHWPGRSKLKPDDELHSKYRKESWRALEDLQHQGLLKSIGVSNFTKSHLEDLIRCCNIIPAINQVEFHPHLQQKELLKYCQEHGIFLQAYSSLGTGQILDDAMIVEVAKGYDKSPSQVLLKWALQQNVGVIPKSTNPVHIKNNIHLSDFVISESDMELISSLNMDKHYCWDPHTIK